MIKTIIATIPIENEIQIGDNTHHQDHVIAFINFNTIKATVNKPANPIPPEFELLFFSPYSNQNKFLIFGL